LTTDHLNALNAQLKTKFGLQNFNNNSNDFIQEEKIKQKRNYTEIKSTLVSLEERLNEQIKSEVNKIQLINNDLSSINEIEIYIKNNKQFYDSISETLKEISSMMSTKPDYSIVKIIEDLEYVISFSDRLKESDLVNNLITKEKQLIENIESKNKDLSERLVYFDKATDTLEFILSGSEQEELNLFFTSHLNSILDIFKSIHHPKEFKHLFLEEDKIYLVDKNDEKRSLSQISTGQRSAFVISVFLSLNMRLKKGPDIIMFDDPISFIDDINSLSFLDFLRMFSHKYDRQIFFSTANKKLTRLFKHKFDYLRDDFKVLNLRRN